MGAIPTTYDRAKDLAFVRADGGMAAHDFMNWVNMYRSNQGTALILTMASARNWLGI
jgi:hypothetical protein